jgi:hypothetical protein
VRFRFSPFLVAALAASSFAATFTVSKDGRGAYTTIQAAVDKAQPYDEVVILDTATYPEQVTLRSPLHHFTLRSSNPASTHKPVIRWSDLVNIGPRTCQEALDTSKITFDKNGALRLIDVRDVRVEGIAVDALGAAPFSNPNVWGDGVTCNGQLYTLFHGNTGVVLYQSSRVVLDQCEIFNAYFGAYIKDRDAQGPFRARENSSLIPPFAHISSGNHFFEGNSIHHNTWGIFVESAWGLGSTFRDNLLYENHHATPAAAAAVKAMSSEGPNQPSGAFFFKDAQFSSMALLNNTFWHNYGIVAGGFRPGAPHLIVNNTFAAPNEAWSANREFPNPFMELGPYFPKRMKGNAFAAQTVFPALKPYEASVTVIDSTYHDSHTFTRSLYYSETPVRIMNNFPSLAPDTSSILFDPPPSSGVPPTWVSLPFGVYTGAVFKEGSAPYDFSSADQNRWVETKFKSYDPVDSGFLAPSPEFQPFLDSGWSPLRYSQASGAPAPLGALPAALRPQALLRIVPLAPVLVEGSQMVLRFSVQALQGAPAVGAVPVISYLRLQKKLPDLPLSYGGSSAMRLPEAEAIPLPATPIRFGYNEVKLPHSGLSADSNALGFVEMAVQGMGTLSNVAEFPILPLSPLFTVEALDETQDVPADGFAKGKTFRLRVAYAQTPAVAYPVRIALASGAHLKFITPANADSSGSIASPLPFTAQVQFTETPDDGVELIWAAAYMDSRQAVTGFGQSRALVFEGTPSVLGRGKKDAMLKPRDILKRRNLLGKKIGPNPR